VKGAEVVLTLLSSPQEAEDVYLGEGGVFEKAHDAGLFIDLGTSSPRLAKELYALAAVHDQCFVEAPLELSFQEPPADGLAPSALRAFAAGDPDSLQRALPVLGLLVPEVVDAGLPGCGVACKLASQIAVAGALMGVVEAVTFALLVGVEPARIPQVLEHGAASSVVARAFGKRILDEEFYQGGDLRLFFNELTSALDVADSLDLALPGLETAHQLYDLLVLIGGGKKGIHALALIYYDEKRCVAHGLDWELAQRAMDVYERANENCSGCAYGDDYEYDYDDDEDCDEDACGHSHRSRSSPHHPDDDDIPLMGGYFSSN
jgi:3-hydroxyisobutyrate dehydrogenase